MKIAMISSESNPLCKSGGLADVVYSLSEQLVHDGHEVIIVLPCYRGIANGTRKLKKVASFTVYMSWRRQAAMVYETTIEGIRFYLIANDYYFDRDKLYGYDDDGERFAFFALASVRLLKKIGFKASIVHVHDWQTAMVPCLAKEKMRDDPFYDGMKFVLTIHNPAFKGMVDRYFLQDFYGLDDSLFDTGKVRFNGMVSTLKSGIVYSDRITTVSPTHREELLRSDSGQGLEGVLNLRRDDFLGILNGIDYEEWNPATDPFIAKNYDAKTLREGKSANQSALLGSFHIKWYGGPVYGFVSRLSWQKGIDLLLPCAERALSKGASMAILGSGEYELEQRFESLRKRYPDTLGLYIGYNEPLAHKIYAGSDFFLMPSLFEPCGLSQMIAQRYGTLPIVRFTGGLSDTVEGYDETKGGEGCDGIGFRNYDEGSLEYAMSLSRKVAKDKNLYYGMAKRAMGIDHSWRSSEKRYVKLYEDLLK
ncbi:MAG: glycogen synthase [Bacilli bacterium]|jgi:starch synthase|nr:glycogen synthase [Bacilli bacterium]